MKGGRGLERGGDEREGGEERKVFEKHTCFIAMPVQINPFFFRFFSFSGPVVKEKLQCS